MAVTLSEVEDLVLSILNASPTYGAASDDPLHPDGEITAAVKASALAVIGAILDAPNHRRRAEFLSLASIPADGLVKGSIGAVVIDDDLGTKIHESKLRRFRNNVASLTLISSGGYFSIEDHVIKFVGSDGEVQTIDDSSGTLSSQVPDEYFWTVVAGALALTFPKEGSNAEIALGFGNLQSNMLDKIRAGATDVTAVTEYGTKS